MNKPTAGERQIAEQFVNRLWLAAVHMHHLDQDTVHGEMSAKSAELADILADVRDIGAFCQNEKARKIIRKRRSRYAEEAAQEAMGHGSGAFEAARALDEVLDELRWKP